MTCCLLFAALLCGLFHFVCVPCCCSELAMQLADQFRAFGVGMSLKVGFNNSPTLASTLGRCSSACFKASSVL